MANRAEQTFSLLNFENRKGVNKFLNETIEKFKEGKDTANSLDFLFYKIGTNKLDESARAEIEDLILAMIKKDAGLISVNEFDFKYGGKFNSLENADLKDNFKSSGWVKHNLKETISTGPSIAGQDSNRIGDLYTRKEKKPMPKKQDKDELSIKKKLEAILKLFNDRNKSKITMTDIKKILTDSTIEERSNVLQRLRAAQMLIEDSPDEEKELIRYYFTEGKILEDSASGTSSSTTWSNWQNVSHKVYINSDGRVKSSNTFLARVSERIDSQKLEYLLSKGVTVIEIEEDGNEIEIKPSPDWLK